DNTIVVVSGDHGAPGFPRGKCNLYDFGTQVPLAVRWPGKVAAGRYLKTPVSLIDLGPTFLDAAGLKAAEDVDGQSMLAALSPATTMPEKLLRGYAIAGRENHADEARPGGLPFPARAIRTGEYLYIINFSPDRWPVAQPPLSAPLIKSNSAPGHRRMDIDFGPTRDFFTKFEGHPSIASEWELGFGRRPAEELYQIASDPDQIRNLSQDSAHDTIRLHLREKLLAELRKGQDPRVVGDGSAFDKRPYAPSDPQRGVIRHRATDRLPDEPSRLP
ncbi:MAG: sulfatase-like hydrolase/transferase, partial [Dechloromonas sp.]|nr:sulfatase-like hydrolase/transferase [Dechloromonas sp.]